MLKSIFSPVFNILKWCTLVQKKVRGDHAPGFFSSLSLGHCHFDAFNPFQVLETRNCKRIEFQSIKLQNLVMTIISVLWRFSECLICGTNLQISIRFSVVQCGSCVVIILCNTLNQLV